MSRSSKRLPGTPGRAPTTPTSGVSSPRSLPAESIPDVLKPPRNPRGLKARDYGFMYHHHPNEADRFDDLIADYKGASKDDDRALLQRQSREYLLKLLNEATERRRQAEEESKEHAESAKKNNKNAEEIEQSMQSDAGVLRELQLELQLLALQYDYKDKELSQVLYVRAKSLRDAKETMQKHVDGLEDSWETYISRRSRENGTTTSARQQRLREYQRQLQLISGKLKEIQDENIRYVELNKNSTRRSSRQNKKIKKLSALLGIPLPAPQKRAAFAGKPEIFGDAVTTETASYSTEYCSTCGETLSSSSSSRSSSSSSVSMKSALGLSKPRDIRETVIPIHNDRLPTQKSHNYSTPARKKHTLLATVHKVVTESKHLDPEVFDSDVNKFSDTSSRQSQSGRSTRQRRSKYEGNTTTDNTKGGKGRDPERGFKFPFFGGHHHL